MADIDLTDGAESPVDESVRKKLALALDLDDMVEAHRMAASLRPWFGVAKVGLELFSAAGPDAIGMLRDGSASRRVVLSMPRRVLYELRTRASGRH